MPTVIRWSTSFRICQVLMAWRDQKHNTTHLPVAGRFWWSEILSYIKPIMILCSQNAALSSRDPGLSLQSEIDKTWRFGSFRVIIGENCAFCSIGAIAHAWWPVYYSIHPILKSSFSFIWCVWQIDFFTEKYFVWCHFHTQYGKLLRVHAIHQFGHAIHPYLVPSKRS